MTGNRLSLGITTRKDSGTGRMAFTASTGNVDRAGDIVAQNFDLANFKRNPIMPWMHDYFTPPIGRWHRVGVKGKGDKRALEGEVSFVDRSIHPFAGMIEDMYRSGDLTAVSIGFCPIEFRSLSPEQKQELGMHPWGRYVAKSELLEISGVTIPMNPEALAKSVDAGIMSRDAAKEFASGSLELMRRGLDIEAVEEWLRSDYGPEDGYDVESTSGSPDYSGFTFGGTASAIRTLTPAPDPIDLSPVVDAIGDLKDTMRSLVAEMREANEGGLDPQDDSAGGADGLDDDDDGFLDELEELLMEDTLVGTED